MLRPQDNGIRECKSLDGIWTFTPDPSGIGRTEKWWRAPLRSSRHIAVPASYNDLFVDDDAARHRRRRLVSALDLPAGGLGPTGSLLRFDAATHRASVWVDDDLVMEHEGGYTPFEADISRFTRPGGELRVTVAVNNELTFESDAAWGDQRRNRRHPHTALLPRLLQLRRAPPQRVALVDALGAH